MTEAEVTKDEAASKSSGASRFNVFLVFFIPALGGLIFGYDIGVTSAAVQQMQDPDMSGTQWHSTLKDSPFLQGLITSGTTIGASIGSVLIYFLNDKIGRRAELRFASLYYLIGSVGQLLCANESGGAGIGISILLAFRIVHGFGIAFSMHAAPAYIAEMSPPKSRGMLISLKETLIVLGILFGYIVSIALCSSSSSYAVKGVWGWAYFASLPLTAVMFVGLLRVPRSVRWLLLKGKNDEALASLRFIFFDGEKKVVDIFRDIKSQCDCRGGASGDGDDGGGGGGGGGGIVDSSSDDGNSDLRDLRGGDNSVSIFHQKFRRPLVAGVGLVMLQQATGQPSILTYTSPILEDAGVADYSSIFIGIFKLVSTLFAVFYVDSRGRRKLLILGSSMMFLSLTSLTVILLLGSHDDDGSGESGGTLNNLTLVAMFIYIAGYQIGFGPIVCLVISEVFPLACRGQAIAFAVITNFFMNTAVQLVIPTITNEIGSAPLFAIFASLCLYSIFFVKKYVPETKGLTLEEIENFFDNKTRHTHTEHNPLIHRSNASDKI